MKKRIQKSEYRSRKSVLRKGILLCFLATMIGGCAQGLRDAREIKNAPMPPAYVETRERAVYSSEGSLWKDAASLYEDRKAKRVNDLVTILITERSAASKKATTNASRDSKDNDYNITNLFGANLDFNLHNAFALKDFYKGANTFTPRVQGSGSSDFQGKGDTTREGRLTATITAKVVEVLPNANLVLESRKEVVVNNEKEIVVLRGIIRPDDISSNNTVLSQNIADAQIYLVGDGVLDDKQSQGWLVRFLDQVWPF
ncbi:MAG: flagellar basal body L-ring protein FlgH [Nitrospirota bacterium]